MNIQEYFGSKKQDGEVGLEIELEGPRVSRIESVGWRLEHDGSLRDEAVELVLRKPCKRADVHKYLNNVVSAVRAADAEVLDTGRAGVHVHVNVQDLEFHQLFNFICAYLILEDILIQFCGKYRVGNLFCLRARDAEALIDTLRETAREKDLNLTAGDQLRYAALNVSALKKYGSLEFRAMRSTVDPVVLQTWVDSLLAIKDWSMQFNDPQELVMQFSQVGPERIFQDTICKFGVFTYDENGMFDGVRQAQYLAFALKDWKVDTYQDFLDFYEDLEIEALPHSQDILNRIESRELFYADINMSNYLMAESRNFLRRKEERIKRHPDALIKRHVGQLLREGVWVEAAELNDEEDEPDAEPDDDSDEEGL